MTKFDDPWLVDAMWRATDLTRAYLSQNRAHIEGCLADLDFGRMERVLAWLVLDHDELFDRLGEPSMAVREIDAVAALSPMENEFATTSAVRRVALRETGLTAAVGPGATRPGPRGLSLHRGHGAAGPWPCQRAR